MKILKNPKYIIITILQIILIISSFIINHLTLTKMGMTRHMVYLNSKLPEFIQIHTKSLTWLLIVVMTLITVQLVKSNKVAEKASRVMYVLLLFIAIFMKETNKAFYVMMGIYAAVAILEYMKMLWTRKEI